MWWSAERPRAEFRRRTFQAPESSSEVVLPKTVLWSAFFSLVALVIYVRCVMSSPSPASSLPVKLYAVLAPVAFLLIVALFWRHNHSTYQSQYSQWNRSFICERCGAVSQHELTD